MSVGVGDGMRRSPDGVFVIVKVFVPVPVVVCIGGLTGQTLPILR